MNSKNREISANTICGEIIKWMKEHKKHPNLSSKDPIEKKFSRWIYNQKQTKKGNGKGIFYESNEKLMNDAGYKGIFENKSLEEHSNEICKNVIDWAKKHKSLPKIKSNDIIEKKFAQWLAAQKQAKKGKSSSLFYKSNEELFDAAGYKDILNSVR